MKFNVFHENIKGKKNENQGYMKRKIQKENEEKRQKKKRKRLGGRRRFCNMLNINMLQNVSAANFPPSGVMGEQVLKKKSLLKEKICAIDKCVLSLRRKKIIIWTSKKHYQKSYMRE
jgi:hypothetical protein